MSFELSQLFSGERKGRGKGPAQCKYEHSNEPNIGQLYEKAMCATACQPLLVTGAGVPLPATSSELSSGPGLLGKSGVEQRARPCDLQPSPSL